MAKFDLYGSVTITHPTGTFETTQDQYEWLLARGAVYAAVRRKGRFEFLGGRFEFLEEDDVRVSLDEGVVYFGVGEHTWKEFKDDDFSIVHHELVEIDEVGDDYIEARFEGEIEIHSI